MRYKKNFSTLLPFFRGRFIENLRIISHVLSFMMSVVWHMMNAGWSWDSRHPSTLSARQYEDLWWQYFPHGGPLNVGVCSLPVCLYLGWPSGQYSPYMVLWVARDSYYRRVPTRGHQGSNYIILAGIRVTSGGQGK